jgi:hypothetical protein
MTPCTCVSALSREAALRRLADCPATKRGERVENCVIRAKANAGTVPNARERGHPNAATWEAARHAFACFGCCPQCWRIGNGAWVASALPLRKAREERQAAESKARHLRIGLETALSQAVICTHEEPNCLCDLASSWRERMRDIGNGVAK